MAAPCAALHGQRLGALSGRRPRSASRFTVQRFVSGRRRFVIGADHQGLKTTFLLRRIDTQNGLRSPFVAFRGESGASQTLPISLRQRQLSAQNRPETMRRQLAFSAAVRSRMPRTGDRAPAVARADEVIE
jgi:hypothetical protein